mgnify:CR=1 FL=1
MSFIFYKKKIFNSNKGFAIPQILILGIGIAVGVSGLMAASILGLTGSRINRQELLAKAASYSGITRIRTLFNDNSQGRLLNYFWLVDNCSEKAKGCDSINISNPSYKYWSDDTWCNNEENCSGRQKAPLCPSAKNIAWDDEQQLVSTLFSGSNYIGNNLENSERSFEQSFNLISTKYIGTEDYGINSILIEGLAFPKNSNTKSASNKLRVNIQVKGQTSEAGFGFISVGENNADKKDSLFLGNLFITPSNNAKGSIIWRMNLENINDCNNPKEMARGEDALLPKKGNGGIWIQPLSLPKQPRLKNVVDLGNLICTSKNYEKTNSKCKLTSNNLSEKTYRINSLFTRGPGSIFEVSTTNEKKIILEIMGDIDISNEGKFCHRNGNEDCGTGKPENLTILFKQKTNSEERKLFCNRENINGGIKIKNNDFSNTSILINNDKLPGHSFLIDNTGNKFGAFIYGPKTTFLSIKPKSKYVQISNSENGSNSGIIVTSRGSYGYIRNSSGSSIDETITNLILDSEMRLIPYGSENNLEVIAIGEKIANLPTDSLMSSETDKVFLLYDNTTSQYHLRSYYEKNINQINSTSIKNSYPGYFAILNAKNSQNNINLGSNLENNSYINSWLDAFNINLKESNNGYIRNFSGAAWVKNFCLDNEGTKTWEFSKEFIENLIAWHGESFNWGIKSYRGQSIILWDTLRVFD